MQKVFVTDLKSNRNEKHKDICKSSDTPHRTRKTPFLTAVKDSCITDLSRDGSE